MIQVCRPDSGGESGGGQPRHGGMIRALLSAGLRALPVIGPLLRRLDTVELYAVMHEAELDLVRARHRAEDEEKARQAVKL